MIVQILRQIGGGRVRVVTANGVQNVNMVLAQLLGRNLKRVVAFLDQATLDQVLRIGQLDARVADR